MTDLTARLSAALADRYVVETELGAGGMAIVYLAHDIKHDRKVAVKVLRPELAAVLGHERFLREITTTANLRHPHILPLYDSGIADDFLFYVMPLVEGETLRARIDREKQLPIDDALQIAREVADALSYAHSRGVIHRDIKPENILLESGHAVVSDFGIARAVGVAGGEQLTQTGVSIGTPTYMSPEQSSGEHDVDGRSDLYSLGCVLYEMLAGQPPFVGPTVENVVHQHLASKPKPVTELRSSVPSNVETALVRSLAKAPADRYATTVEFAESLGPADMGATVRPVMTVKSTLQWLVPAAAFAAVAIAAVSLIRQPGSGSTDDRPTLAVLPFDNYGATEDEYFADGITEEMTSRLAEISGLGVVSRTSAIRYKAVDKSLREIADELGVAYVLEGSVRTDRYPGGTDQVRVTAQLIRAADDSHLWTDQYTADLVPGEIFLVQATIAEQVAGALDVTLLGSEREALEIAPTEDAEAYDAYLLGRFYWNRRSAADLLRATEYFQRAVTLDSAFAEAQVGLADTYSLYGYYLVPGMSRAEAYVRAEEAARRAIALDTSLAGAWTSLGNVLTYGAWEWEAADSAFQRAIELDPEYPVARYWYAELLLIVGRLEEAIEQARYAVQLDPASPVAHHVLGSALMYAGRYEEAVVSERASVDLVPDFFYGRAGLAWALAFAGRIEEGTSALVQAGWPQDAAAYLGRYMSWTPADTGLATDIGRFEQESATQGMNMAGPGFFALLYAWVHENDSAFARLEEALSRRSEAVLYNVRHPLTDPIRSDPRYAEFMERVGLTP